MKASEVEIIASSKIDPEHLGTFYNSLQLSNYDFSLKSELKEEDSKEKENEDVFDERTKRTKKTIDNIALSHESHYEKLPSFKLQRVCAEATIFARNLANTRANPATPQWMEDQINKLLTEN